MKKTYKIGEFAKNLGVTIGFLKHHEADNILTPYISSSGYRYYEYSQGMQALQCLRLQSIGFSSKEIAMMLNDSESTNISEKVLQKKKELQEDIIYYQELLDYLEKNTFEEIEENQNSPMKEEWEIKTPEPFYYLENSEEGEFFSDPENQIYDVVCNWNRYMPMTGLCSYIKIDFQEENKSKEGEFTVQRWAMGLQISQKTGDTLHVLKNEKVQLITPGKCLIYSFSGIRERLGGRSHIPEMLRKPVALCKEHNLTITGEVYCLNVFSSSAKNRNYLHEIVILPLK